MRKTLYSDERGFLLVITMIILVILTIVGISSLDNSVFEIRIASNDRSSRVAFNLADGALFASSKLIDEARATSVDPPYGTVEYLNFNGLNKTTGDVENVTNNVGDFQQRTMMGMDTKNEAGLAVTPDLQMRPFGPGQPESIDVYLMGVDADSGEGFGVESHSGSLGEGVSGGKFVLLDIDVEANAARNSRSSVSARIRKKIN